MQSGQCGTASDLNGALWHRMDTPEQRLTDPAKGISKPVFFLETQRTYRQTIEFNDIIVDFVEESVSATVCFVKNEWRQTKESVM